MITLIEETKVVSNGTTSYTLDLQFDLASDFDKLPNANKPFTHENFAIGVDYGVPAVGSTATYTVNGTSYMYTASGTWVEGGAGETETKTVTITSNGTTEVTPTAGKTMTKVTVQTNVPTVELLDYTVTFKVDNENYAIFSVEAGQSVAAPNNPTPETGYFFAGWRDSNENTISFPYTPNADITLNAYFIQSLVGKTYSFTTESLTADTFVRWLVDYTISINDTTVTPNTMNGVVFGGGKTDLSDGKMLLASEVTFIVGTVQASTSYMTGKFEGMYGVIVGGTSDRVRTLTFTGGEDINNIDFITYVTTHGTLVV